MTWPTLDRLARGRERDGLKELASKIAVARKLAGAARAEDSTATVAVDEMTLTRMRPYKGCCSRPRGPLGW